MTAILADSASLCSTTVVPKLGMNCPAGILSLIEISNLAFCLLYLYFTAVAYESWVRGCSMPSLIKKQVLAEERARVKRENEKKEKAELQTELARK